LQAVAVFDDHNAPQTNQDGTLIKSTSARVLQVLILLLPIKPVEPSPPFHVYQEQLSPLFNGLALWQPDPGGVYDHVSIGDVGYISDNGAFIRMFNVALPWNHPSNKRLGEPDQYDPLILGEFTTIHRMTFGTVEHCSRVVLIVRFRKVGASINNKKKN